ncbi:hypothetical protein PHET_09827 [Paragonimus heterotremus]|uniref:Uncharacterized protein n=1 Tax=Paragonimus heterotremus TaxID=100268 RepID=A0A8J4T2I6_9TREM|nr:hypothetical protein PHET_09827 [Paragonimus heterotremus]
MYVDIVDPTLPPKDSTQFLICPDRSTHLPQVVPILDVSAENIIQTFMETQTPSFGTPTSTTTGRSSLITSTLFRDLRHPCGFEQLRKIAHHTAVNAEVEHFHPPIKVANPAMKLDSN